MPHHAPFYFVGLRRGPGLALPRTAIPFPRYCDRCQHVTILTVGSLEAALAAPDRRGRPLTPLCLHCAEVLARLHTPETLP